MNKKSLLLIAVLIIALVFAGCAAKEDSTNFVRTQSMEAPAAPAMEMEMADGDIYYGDDMAKAEEGSSNSGAEDAKEFSEKIIYNANMSLEADDPVETAKKIKETVNAMGGYVSSSSTSKYDEYTSYVNMQIRVPAKGFNDMVDYLYSISKVENEYMYTDNITESYYDAVARLEHYEAQAEQLEALMEEAETIEDVLAVRQELSWVQENIEVFKGRLRMWDSLVDYSTIDIYIAPTPTIDTGDGLIRLISLGETGRGIVRALKNSVRFVANFFSILVRVLAALLIPAIIVVPIVWIIVRVVKKNRKKRKKDLNGNVTIPKDNQG